MRIRFISKIILLFTLCFALGHTYAGALAEDTLLVNAHIKLGNAIKVKNWTAAGRAGYEVSNINYKRYKIDEAIKYSLLGIDYSV